MAIYTLHSDMIFRSSKRMEADLPQPEGGKEKCHIIAADGESDPIPFRSEGDLRRVISEEMLAAGVRWWPEDREALVKYYLDTWESYSGRVSELKQSLADIGKRGEGIDILFEGLAA